MTKRSASRSRVSFRCSSLTRRWQLPAMQQLSRTFRSISRLKRALRVLKSDSEWSSSYQSASSRLRRTCPHTSGVRGGELKARGLALAWRQRVQIVLASADHEPGQQPRQPGKALPPPRLPRLQHRLRPRAHLRGTDAKGSRRGR
eukprot:1185313-Prorocentrum_minimum.AAC.2